MTKLYWLDETWPGKLALAARPRGGEWLEDDLDAWKHEDVDAVLSLLTSDEERALELVSEPLEARRMGLRFVSFPIADRDVPQSEAELVKALEEASRLLVQGKNLVVHCRQGVGRSGLVAACLLVRKGMSPGAAVDKVSVARGVAVPETPEQREWIDHFAGAYTK